MLYSVFSLLLLQQYSCAQSQPITDSGNNSTPEIILNINQAPEKFIAGNYSLLEVDNLNCIYLLGESGQLKKFNPNGDSLSVFNDVKKYGSLNLMDVSNPLKVLLFYKSYATIVSLDKMLTLRNSMNLRKQGIFSVNAIANAYDNNIWVFDEQDFTLKKISEQGKLLQQTNDMRMFPGATPQVSSITDHNNFTTKRLAFLFLITTELTKAIYLLKTGLTLVFRAITFTALRTTGCMCIVLNCKKKQFTKCRNSGKIASA